METSYHYLKENSKYILIIIFILCITYIDLFFGENVFNSNELDIHVMYDYLSRSNLNGWRADKIIGTNMLIGDPSFNAWSIINLIFRIPLENKIILHNFIFLALTLYASISIYILINFANPKINKISASILSSLIFISCLRFEVNYVFSWILVFPTVAFTSLILFKFFETGKINYIFLLFLNFFVGFNLGSIFAIQQSLFFSFIFFLLYSFYFKKFVFFQYIKIIFVSLFFLLFSSSWIFYPYILEIFNGGNELARTADYIRYLPIEFDRDIFKFFFHLIFGSLINTNYVNLIDFDLIPSSSFITNLPIFINLVLLFYIFKKEKIGFWLYLSKYLILFYLTHTFLTEISPLYESLNLFIVPTMPWSKVYIELYIFQILIISFFITEKKIDINIFTKIYAYLLLFFKFALSLFLIENFFKLNLTEKIITFVIDNFFSSKILSINTNLIKLIIEENILRFQNIIDINLIFFNLLAVALIYIFLKLSNTSSIKINFTIVVILILLCNFFKASHFFPIEKNNKFIWQEVKNENIFNKTDRLIALTDNYLLNIKPIKINTNDLTVDKFNNWKDLNKISSKTKTFGIMSPPFLSFSSNASFIPKQLQKELKNSFNLIPSKIKESYTSLESFEMFQEGIYSYNMLNNLSINYAYSRRDIKNYPYLIKNLDLYWSNEDLYIYKIKSTAVPYYYIADNIKKIRKPFIETRIDINEVYLDKNNFDKFKNIKNGPGKITINNISNSKMKFKYKSNYENILVISDAFDNNWKAESDTKHEVFKVNYFFKGILLKPGEYEIDVYFENKKYFFGIYLSIISIIIIYFIYLKVRKI